MSDTPREGESPHDSDEQHTDTTPDWEGVGRNLARDRLEAAAFDLREAFLIAAHDDELAADDLSDLFDELQTAARVVGKIAEHTPGAVDESDPYRNLSQEELKKAVGLGREESSAAGGRGK